MENEWEEILNLKITTHSIAVLILHNGSGTKAIKRSNI